MGLMFSCFAESINTVMVTAVQWSQEFLALQLGLCFWEARSRDAWEAGRREEKAGRDQVAAEPGSHLFFKAPSYAYF